MLIAPEITPEAAEAVALLRDEQDGFDTVQAFWLFLSLLALNLGSFPLVYNHLFSKYEFAWIFLIKSFSWRPCYIENLHRGKSLCSIDRLMSPLLYRSRL